MFETVHAASNNSQKRVYVLPGISGFGACGQALQWWGQYWTPCPISQFAYGTSTGHGSSLMNTMRQELESDLFIEPQVSLSRAVDEAEPLRLAWDA